MQLDFLLIRYKRRRANSNEGVHAAEQSDTIIETNIKLPTTSTHHHISGTETLFSELSPQKVFGAETD